MSNAHLSRVLLELPEETYTKLETLATEQNKTIEEVIYFFLQGV